jgi:hypothetical protein
MVSQPQIKKVDDMARLAIVIAPVLQGDAWLLNAVVSGEAKAYQVDDWRSTWIVRADGAELVFCCVIGEDLEPALNIMWPLAIAQGFKTARFHTQRKGLARLLKHWGPTFTEYVYKVRIA